METIKIQINGQEIETTPDKTILDVVHERKLDSIPTLCHDKRLEHFTSCFLCVVEVEGVNRLLPSCSTKVVNGWKIQTNSDTIRESRKTALELLLSNHYADCIGPCRSNCPAEVDAQSYIALISMGKYSEALQLVKENNPLPLSIGRVCVRDCEQACRRNYVDEPVAVNTLKRYIADIDAISKWTPPLKPRNGKKVAIIGSGPAGLTCAYYLVLQGYEPTIFEKLPELGGMLRYGIPEYRLPKNVLDSEIQWILDLGVDVRTGVALGKDFSLDDLRGQGYKAIFVGVGAHKASKLGLDGEEKTVGVYRGIDFLREVTQAQDERRLGEEAPLHGNIIVVGGGNTAIDAARTALRSGAKSVKIVYRRSIKEMPAHHEEIEAAQKEGVEILFLTNPKSMVIENGTLKGIECLRMELVPGKPGERPRPVTVEGSEFIVPCDYIISAIGQAVDTTFAEKDKELTLDRWGTITVNQDTLETSIPGVFSGGDAVTGPLTAISSIAQGRKAAYAIMGFLEKGKAQKPPKKFYSLKSNLSKISDSEYSSCGHIERERMSELDVEDRIHSFEEVEHAISEEQSRHEVDRCLECGCSEFSDCILRKYCDDYEIEVENLKGDVTKYKVDDRHPFLVFDANKCINCGKCVRTCSDVMRVSALGFVHRGFRTVVKPAMDKPLAETSCTVCGNCIDVCPTGAIAEKFPFKILGTLPKQNIETICGFCSIGCRVNYKKIDNDIFFIQNSTGEIQDSHNRGYLCTKGRFGHRYLMQKNRVFAPAVKKDGVQMPVPLDEAITTAADSLRTVQKKYGADSIGVFVSPKLSNEELFLLQSFARKALNTNHIGSFSYQPGGSRRFALDGQFGITASTVSTDALHTAGVVVLTNSNISEEHLVMELKLREAQKRGTRIILMNNDETPFAKYADLWIDNTKGTNGVLLNMLMKSFIDSGVISKNAIRKKTGGLKEYQQSISNLKLEDVLTETGISEGQFSKLSQWLGNPAENVVFIHNEDSNLSRDTGALSAIANYLLLTNRVSKAGNGLILLHDHVNSAGLFDMGADHRYLPGRIRSGAGENELPAKLRSGKIKAAVIFGEDPFSDVELQKQMESFELVIACDTHLTATVAKADVVIPANTIIEQSGTYTRHDNVIQKSAKVVNGVNSISNWQVIQKLIQCFIPDMSISTLDDIHTLITNESNGRISFSEGTSWTETYFRNGFTSQKVELTPYSTETVAGSQALPAVTYADRYFRTAIQARIAK